MTSNFEVEVRDPLTLVRVQTNQPDDYLQREDWRREFKAAIDACETPLLVLNMAQVQRVDSLLLGTLASAQRRLEQRGTRIRLCHLSSAVEWALEVTMLEELFDVYPDERTASA